MRGSLVLSAARTLLGGPGRIGQEGRGLYPSLRVPSISARTKLASHDEVRLDSNAAPGALGPVGDPCIPVTLSP